MLILAFDVINQAYVGGYASSALSLPSFRQGQYVARIYLVQPVAESIPGQQEYEAYDSTGYSLRVGIWSSSTGTLGDEDALALALTDQTGWTYNTSVAGFPYYTGTFNTYTSEMASLIGSSNSASAYFAVNLTAGGILFPVYDHRGANNVTVLSATDGGGGAPVDMTSSTPRITLPLEILDPGSGELFAITRTSSGVLEFSFIGTV